MAAPLPPSCTTPGGISVATWNIAAVNNNPFEYWISHDDALYAKLMADFERFIETPGESDVPVSAVFSEQHFEQLMELMKAEGWSSLDTVREAWDSRFSKSKIVSQFLTDKSLGSKRLVSMPDRITNTMRASNKLGPVCRPTVINQYVDSLTDVQEWWPKWQEFMFREVLEIEQKGKTKSARPCEMLGRISRSKYPALTEEEEVMSIPLQTLCMAIFDAILVHIMSSLSPDGRWQDIKRSMVEAMLLKKDELVLDVLRQTCAGVDVICLQEVALKLKEKLQTAFGSDYVTLSSFDADSKRNQNSLLLLRRATFPGNSTELTSAVHKVLGGSAPVEAGDLIAVSAADATGNSLLIASFHGDTNGLATKPVVKALMEVLREQPSRHQLVFGLDANTDLQPKSGAQDVADFLVHCKAHSLISCWDGKHMADCCTTCHARTYVQPQFNKAIKSSELLLKGSVNPKDHILVSQDAFEVLSACKDNTGERKYIEGMAFPTLRFPSDHALVSAVFKRKGSGEADEEEEADGISKELSKKIVECNETPNSQSIEPESMAMKLSHSYLESIGLKPVTTHPKTLVFPEDKEFPSSSSSAVATAPTPQVEWNCIKVTTAMSISGSVSAGPAQKRPRDW